MFESIPVDSTIPNELIIPIWSAVIIFGFVSMLYLRYIFKKIKELN